MLHIPGYEVLHLIAEGRDASVLRATRSVDDRPVVVKVPKISTPPNRTLARLAWEHQVLQRIEHPAVISTLGLVDCSHGQALILEDFFAWSLREVLSDGPMDLTDALHCVLGVLDALAATHAAGVIHRDIKPDNILVNDELQRIVLIDFSISSLTGHEEVPSQTSGLEGTLEYMSPEQTGRTNRVVDYRSDYYSLGVTLYEMITGERPFQCSDPLELVHRHIAHPPPPLTDLRPGTPDVLSRIVLKLMSKTPQERYQSTIGLRTDLNRCLQFLESELSIDDFSIARQDVSEVMRIPETLFGRQDTLTALSSAVDRVVEGATELQLICGPSGAGKSSLLRPIHGFLEGTTGYFVSGQCDQIRQDIPYVALIQALQDLVRRLVVEPKIARQSLGQALNRELGPNGQVIIDVLGDLEIIVGPQPAVVALSPTESANRFRTVFTQVIRVLAAERPPLVIFLDDLQWSDPATLTLVETTLLDPGVAKVLWIGAYRHNEIEPTHPISVWRANLEAVGAAAHAHILSPLALHDTTALVQQTLAPCPQDLTPLAEWLQSRTDGNPLFVVSFLQSLHAQQLVSFDRTVGYWRWDAERMDEVSVLTDLIELIDTQIDLLPTSSQQALQIAACIGNRFQLKLLADVLEWDLDIAAEAISAAITQGLVQPTEGLSDLTNRPTQAQVQFVHNRVQQAILARIRPARQEQVHLTIGQMLLTNTADSDRDASTFEIVSHLNASINLIDRPEDLLQLAELNLTAARRARRSVAFESARTYARRGLSLLPEDAWSRHYDLAFGLHLTGMEAEFFSGDFNAGEALFTPLVHHAQDDVERGEVYRLKILLDYGQGRYESAIDTGVEGVKQLGVQLPKRVGTPRFLMELLKLRLSLGFRDPRTIPSLPELTDLRQRKMLQILITICPAAYFVNPLLYSFIQLRICGHSLRHGVTGESAFGFAGFGMVLAGSFGAYSLAAEMGNVAKKLHARFQSPTLGPILDVVEALFLGPWVRPYSESLFFAQRGYKSAIQNGDLSYAYYNANAIVGTMLNEGRPLEEILEIGEDLATQSARINGINPSALLTFSWRFALCMSGQTNHWTSFSCSSWDEEAYLALGNKEDSSAAIDFFRSLWKAVILYLFGQYDQARELLELARANTETAFCSSVLVFLALYEALTAVALLTQDPTQHAGQRKLISKRVKWLKNWAKHCPHNFEPLYQVALAEQSLLNGQNGAALLAYDRAVQAAQEGGSLHLESVALELAARARIRLGMRAAAEGYLHSARDAYARWGARIMVDRLDEMLKSKLTTPTLSTTMRSTTLQGSTALDVGTVIKGSQAISSQIQLDKLLREFLQIVMENAGAQRGALLLPESGELKIEAELHGEGEQIAVLQSIALDASNSVCTTIVQYVAQTGNDVVLGDAQRDETFGQDPYVSQNNIQSILCMPISLRGRFMGVLYLENNLILGAFTAERCELLRVLSTQATISIENARLVANLERLVEKRTRKLEETNSILTASNQELDSFAHTVAHDLKNLLAGIQGYSEVLREEWGQISDPEAQELLQGITNTTKKTVDVIHALLLLANVRKGEVEVQPVDMSGLVSQVVQTLSHLARSHDATIVVAQMWPTAVGHPQWVENVWSNYVSNAIKYGGRPPQIELGATALPNGMIRFWVRDNGPGLSKEQRARLFTPFTRLHQAQEGHGLGLSIVQRIIEKLGGEVGATSQIGQGSEFYFTLPAHLPNQQG